MHNIQLSAENSGSPMANISHHNNYSLQKELLPYLKPEIRQIYKTIILQVYFTNSLWLINYNGDFILYPFHIFPPAIHIFIFVCTNFLIYHNIYKK